LSLFGWAARRVTRMALKNAKDEQDPRLERISSAIRVIPDFPKPGFLSLLPFSHNHLFSFPSFNNFFYPAFVVCLRNFVSGHNNAAS